MCNPSGLQIQSLAIEAILTRTSRVADAKGERKGQQGRVPQPGETTVQTLIRGAPLIVLAGR